MRVNLAHVRKQGIDFAVFDADARSRVNRDRDELLCDLVDCAESAGLKVDKAALAFSEHGRVRFHGTPDLVRMLARNPSYVRWNRWIEV